MATETELREHALDTVREFLYPHLRYRDVGANEQMLVAASASPVTLESVRDAFFRIRHQLATGGDYHAAYEIFFSKHPEYALEGNMSVLDEVHHGEDVTAETLEELLQNPNVLARLAVTNEAAQSQAEAQEHQAIVTEIVGGLKKSIDGRGRTVCLDAEGRHLVDYKTEVERISSSLGLDELRLLKSQKDEVRRLRGMSVEEVRQVVRSNAPSMPSRYEPIPPQYIPPGKFEGLPWSSQLLWRLPTPEQKRLLRIYGNEQITAACAAQQGRH